MRTRLNFHLFLDSSVCVTISVNIEFGNSVAQRLRSVPSQKLLAPAGSLETCRSTMYPMPYLSAPSIWTRNPAALGGTVQ